MADRTIGRAFWGFVLPVVTAQLALGLLASWILWEVKQEGVIFTWRGVLYPSFMTCLFGLNFILSWRARRTGSFQLIARLATVAILIAVVMLAVIDDVRSFFVLSGVLAPNEWGSSWPLAVANSLLLVSSILGTVLPVWLAYRQRLGTNGSEVRDRWGGGRFESISILASISLVSAIVWCLMGGMRSGPSFGDSAYGNLNLLAVLALGPVAVLACLILERRRPGAGGTLLCLTSVLNCLAIALFNSRTWGVAWMGTVLASTFIALPTFVIGLLLRRAGKAQNPSSPS